MPDVERFSEKDKTTGQQNCEDVPSSSAPQINLLGWGMIELSFYILTRCVEQSFQRITIPYSADEMSALAVSPLVNSAKFDDPKCCEAWMQKSLIVTREEMDFQLGFTY